MKAVYVVADGATEIRDIDTPEIGADDVLIRTKAVGICGSDLHVFLGRHAFRKPPVILGHEVAGEICQIGANVTNLKVGDRVVVNPTVSCGECVACRNNLENACRSRKAPGTKDWVGCFVEYFPAPADKTFKINDDISYPFAALTEPLTVSKHILSQVKNNKKQSIAILGCGSIGLLTQLLAKNEGYTKILCSDPADYNRHMATQLGAEKTVNPLCEDLEEAALDMTCGDGVDVCVIAAGAPNILNQASRITRVGGEIVLVAMITKPQEFDTYTLLSREQTLHTSQLYKDSEFEEALAMINDKLDLSCFISHQFPIDEAQHALEILRDKKENVVKIILEVNQAKP